MIKRVIECSAATPEELRDELAEEFGRQLAEHHTFTFSTRRARDHHDGQVEQLEAVLRFLADLRFKQGEEKTDGPRPRKV